MSTGPKPSSSSSSQGPKPKPDSSTPWASRSPPPFPITYPPRFSLPSALSPPSSARLHASAPSPASDLVLPPSHVPRRLPTPHPHAAPASTGTLLEPEEVAHVLSELAGDLPAQRRAELVQLLLRHVGVQQGRAAPEEAEGHGSNSGIGAEAGEGKGEGVEVGKAGKAKSHGDGERRSPRPCARERLAGPDSEPMYL